MKKTTKTHPQRLPWWIYIIFAALLYIGFIYCAPAMQIQTPWISALLHVVAKLAPIGAIIFLLLGAQALYDNPEKKLDPPETKDDEE
jgi:TRAP-type C4-dicarboxylate transport system permease small subunit